MLNRPQYTADKALNTSSNHIIRFLSTRIDNNLQNFDKGQNQSSKSKRSNMIFIDPSNTSQAIIIVLAVVPSSTCSSNQKGKNVIKEYGHKYVSKDEECEDTVIAISALLLNKMVVCSELHCYYAYSPEDEEENR